MEHLAIMGCELDLKNVDGNTPFMLAVRDHKLDAMRWLGKRPEVNINEKTRAGSTAVHVSAGTGDCEVLAVLARSGLSSGDAEIKSRFRNCGCNHFGNGSSVVRR